MAKIYIADNFIKSGGTISQALLADGSVLLNPMTLISAQTVSGVTTFLNGTIGHRNVANTFTSFINNSNTASRTYTLPDKNGIFAMTSDIIAQLNGSVNTLVKFGTPNTGANSRISDNGSTAGIGTVNTPSFDWTLGYQADRQIGIEESDNSVKGRNLMIGAGRTINYVPNSNFNLVQTIVIGNALNQFATSNVNGTVYLNVWGGGGGLYRKQPTDLTFINTGGIAGGFSYGCAVTNTDDIYIAAASSIYKNGVVIQANPGAYGVMAYSNNGNLYLGVAGATYIQIGGVGSFTLLQSDLFTSICGHPSNNDVYGIKSNFLWKQTNGTGLFINTGISTPSGLGFLTITPNNNFYIAGGSNSDIYKQTNGAGAFIALGQPLRGYYGLGYKLNNDVYALDVSGNIYLQNNDVVGTPDLDGGTLVNVAGTGKGIGQSRYQVWTGQKTVSGTDMQVLTKRLEIDETGNVMLMTDKIFADNAAALAGGLPLKTIYWTPTGEMRIVV